MSLCIVLGVENDLRESIAVAEVDKDDATVVSTTSNPSHQQDALANLFSIEGAAGMRPFPITEEFRF